VLPEHRRRSSSPKPQEKKARPAVLHFWPPGARLAGRIPGAPARTAEADGARVGVLLVTSISPRIGRKRRRCWPVPVLALPAVLLDGRPGPGGAGIGEPNGKHLPHVRFDEKGKLRKKLRDAPDPPRWKPGSGNHA